MECNIIFTENNDIEDNSIRFNNLEQFIEWYFKNKNSLKNKKINFQIENNINIQTINNLYKFLSFYKETKELCDKFMKEEANKLLQTDDKEEVCEALDQLVRMNEGGKFLRGTLIALGYKASNKYDNDFLKLSSAMEIFQTSILIHDDIIDNDLLRRGKPTIPASYIEKYKDIKNKKELNSLANSMGICIGDLGFYIASQIIIDSYKENPNFSELISYYNQMVIRTCKGEILDVMLPFKEKHLQNQSTLEKIIEIYKLKTAWYSVVGPFCLGFILGSGKETKKIEEALISAGIAFQIKDDILGIFGSEKTTGKSNISDAEEFKQTILYSYVLDTEYKNELLKYYGKENINDEEVKTIREIFIKSGAKENAEKSMQELFDRSIRAIEELNINDESKDLLRGFITYLNYRSK